MPRFQEDVQNASTIEGVEQAVSTIKVFLTKLRKSAENEGSLDLTLCQTTSRKTQTKAEDDAVAEFVFDMQTEISDLATEIADAAVDDCEGLRAKVMKYNVRADGLSARCVFTLRGDDGEEDDIDDIDDMPNKKGLLGLLMRHTQGQHKLSIGTSKHLVDKLMEQLDTKDKVILQLQMQAMENMKAYEELISGRHIRDIELQKMQNKDRRMDQLAGTVMQGFPLLVSKFLGGGAGAAAMQATPGARTSLEGLVEGFTKTLDSEQFQQIMASGLFRPEQVQGLIEIVKFVMEREEAEKNQASGPVGQNGASQANGTNGTHQASPAEPAKQEARP